MAGARDRTVGPKIRSVNLTYQAADCTWTTYARAITRAALAPWVPKALIARASAMDRLRITVPYTRAMASPRGSKPPADPGAEGEVQRVDNHDGYKNGQQKLGGLVDRFGFQRHGDKDDAQHAQRRERRETRGHPLLKRVLPVSAQQQALRQMAGPHGQKHDQKDLPDHQHEIHVDVGAQQQFDIDRGRQRAEHQADHRHLDRRLHVALGKPGPRNRHAAGGHQPRQEQAERQVGFVREEKSSDEQHGERE